MIKILFICHGNICRSPMAETVFRNLLQRKGILKRYDVASAATSTEEIPDGVGNPVYPPAQRELEKHGLSAAGKRAVLLKPEDYENYDLLIGMDERNMAGMRRITGHDKKEKMHKLLEYAGLSRDVADPWYTGRFDLAYADIELGCRALLEYLEKGNGERRANCSEPPCI